MIYIKVGNNSATLNFDQPYVIEADELKEVFLRLYSDCVPVETFDLAYLFWEDEVANDSYKRLWFRDGKVPVHESYLSEPTQKDKEETDLRNIIRWFLDKYIEEDYPYDYILVDVSW